ncbi:spry domain containing socs box protein [Anaeramoeba flamelloides]|uniref:Spry domain containing socs box protein n=1 Tax=Anaeramoeba flamelloides TaxID=1746091 RepID=A0AAV7ZAL9_9EUKA|nr:spry domain containing socs box protein [Anaeramoeba flamelloides]KAJ6233824.1 spry domain containing socs box protein [Anaeramoeba flamelloides]|eukprot:Anaeramoba_flamelloidesa577783_255.p1 GENE.a577783_255~~a577783_255.p1  ORF type:complete len:172 (+),score=32.67 a577783_255:37-552(+)
MSQADSTIILSDNFTTDRKGTHVTLSNDNKTAKLTGLYAEAGWGSVRGETEMKSGSIYQVDFKIDTFVTGGLIRIGAVEYSKSQGGTISIGWIYDLSTARKKNPNTSWTSYGQTFQAGDIITVVLDLIEYNISYLKNGEDLGVAFSNIGQNRTWALLLNIDQKAGTQLTIL